MKGKRGGGMGVRYVGDKQKEMERQNKPERGKERKRMSNDIIMLKIICNLKY